MNTFATIREALAALPVGPEAIADHLAVSGVRAECGEPARCAIAEYLTAVVDVPAGYFVKVSNQSAWFASQVRGRLKPLEHCFFGGRVLLDADHVDRPDIAEFIRNFDRGQYPDLVAGTAEQVSA